MAYAFNDDKSKQEVIPKSQTYGNTFGTTITIPRTLSDSNKRATFNYTFPNDGYLVIKNNLIASGISYNDALKINSIMPVNISESSNSIANVNIFVKKGMVLNGYFESNNASMTAAITTSFYPLNLNS